MGFNDYSINGKNSKPEKLKDIKHGIRREQLDAKFHNLFNLYDNNKDGTLEVDELNLIYTGLEKLSGNDKILSASESNIINSLFKTHIGIDNADFMGFVKSVSDASEDIVSTRQSLGEDGGNVLETKYKNGLTETIYFYPDGEYKMKEAKLDTVTTSMRYRFNNKDYSEKELDELIKKQYNQRPSSVKTHDGLFNILVNYEGYKQNFIKQNRIKPYPFKDEVRRYESELSERAKSDAEVRDFVISHFIETHQECKSYLDEMGMFSDIAAAIGAGSGEAWNWIKNKWNGTEEEYKNFYELVNKFEPQYETVKNSAEPRLKEMRTNDVNYFKGFNEALGGINYSDEQGEIFQQSAYRFQTAQGLEAKVKLLDETLKDLVLANVPLTSSTLVGMDNTENAVLNSLNNPSKKLMDAKAKLAEFFDGDKEIAEAFIKDIEMGTFGNYKTDKLVDVVKGLKEMTETNLKNTLGDFKTLDDAKSDYIQQYKEVYHTDFVPEELTEKAGSALEGGGFVRLGALTALSYLLTKSPLLSNAMGSLGSSAIGRVLVSKFGQQTANKIIQESIRFASMSTTIGLDAGLNAVEQLTSDAGISGEKMADGTLSAAKFIGFSTYIGGPLAQSVAKLIARSGSAGQLFAGGSKTVADGVERTSVSGAKLFENLSKGGSRWTQVAAKAGAFATDAGAFTALEVATEGTDLLEAAKGQGEFLGKLKLMNHVIEYALGKRVHGGVSKVKMDAAIEASGIKEWNITEIKDGKNGVPRYGVDYKGVPLGEYKDIGMIATAMAEKVSKAYEMNESERGSAAGFGAKAEPEANKSNETENTQVEQEVVAPFAQRLTKTPSVEELTNPEVKKVTLENGEINENGEFVPDGTKTFTESGNPFSKSITLKVYPDKREKIIAQTIDELLNQMSESIPTRQKKDFIKREKAVLENYFSRNPEVSPADVSEAVQDYLHATGKSQIANGYDSYTLSLDNILQIKDFKTFKANIKEFDAFITELSNISDGSLSAKALKEQIQRLRAEYFSNDMSEIKPEDFKKNLDYFKTLDGKTQAGLIKYDYDCLFKPHGDKYFENISVANEYNKWVSEYMDKNGYDANLPLLAEAVRYFEKYDDTQISQIRKNIELVKDMISNKSDDYRLMYNILESRRGESNYTDLAERLKAELGDKFDYSYFEITPNKQYVSNEAQFDLSVELAKLFPEGMKAMGSYNVSKLTDRYLKADDAGKQNMSAKIAILHHLPELVMYGKNVNSDYAYKFLSETEIPHAEKIAEFLEHADSDYIARIKRQGNIKIAEIFPPEKIDNMIECAKMHSELPKEFVDYLHSEKSLVGNTDDYRRYSNEKIFNFQYDVEPKEFAERIEAIKQYKDKMSPELLESVYNGTLKANTQILDMVSTMNPIFAKEFVSYSQTYLFNEIMSIDKETAAKFAEFINNSNITQDNARSFMQNFSYNADVLELFKGLSSEELSALSFNSIAKCHIGNLSQYIGNIKENIAMTPKHIRDLVKEDVAAHFYLSSKYDSQVEDYNAKIAQIEGLSDENVQSIGSKVIADYLADNYAEIQSFNNHNLEVWRNVPKEVKDNLGANASKILFSEDDISLETINSRIQKLKEQGVFEIITKDNLISILQNTSKEFEKYLDNALMDPSFNKDSLNYFLFILNDFKNSSSSEWDLIDELVKNPKVKNDEISKIIAPLHRYNKMVREQQKDFLRYLIQREDIDSDTINNLLQEIKANAYSSDAKKELQSLNQMKVDLSKTLLDNPKLKNEDVSRIIKLFDNKNDLIAKKDLYLKMLDKYSVEDIRKINSSLYNSYNSDMNWQPLIEFADKLLYKYNLDTDVASEILKAFNRGPFEDKAVTQKLEDFAEELLNDKSFNSTTLPVWIESLRSNPAILTRQIEFARNQRKNHQLADDDIANVLSYINDYNENIARDQLKLAEELALQNFDSRDISNLISVLHKNQNIATEILSDKILELVSLGTEPNLIANVCSNTQATSLLNTNVIQMLSRLKENGANISEIMKLITIGTIPLRLQDKIDMLLSLSQFTTEDKLILRRQGVDIDSKIETLMNSIDTKYPVITSSKEGIQDFLKHVANNRGADEVIQNADFEKFGKKGIPLQYSRDEFIHNMDKLISQSGIDNNPVEISGVVIPELKLSSQDKDATQTKIDELRATKKMENVEIIMNGQTLQGTQFIGTQGGSNKAYYTQIGDKLYYIKYPKNEKLGQSVQEAMASRLYRAAGIDSPNMEYVYNKDGKVIGLASEYVPNLNGTQPEVKDYADSYAVDAWLANWDAPKNDNTQSRENGIVKVDVGGSLQYRAQGELKDFANVVNEISTLIENNSKFLSMTKQELLSSLKRVTDVSDAQIHKILQESPSNDASLSRTLIKRKEFLTIFAKNLEMLNEADFKNTLEMVNEAKAMTIEEFTDDANIALMLGYNRTKTGFEGLLNTKSPEDRALSPDQLQLAERMIAEIEKFTKGNRVADNVQIEPEVRDFLNSILKGVPEFAPFFGKPQHSTQKYSIDIHILKVLQDSLKDPLYKTLSDTDKIVLKFSTLLHDIGKRYLVEGSDTGHAAKSAEYVYSILDKFNLTPDVKDRIISTVRNHHWFKEYNLGNLDPKSIAAMCRHNGDFAIYQIIAKADLKNVNDNFYKSVLNASSEAEADKVFAEKMAEIAPYVDQLSEKQVVITPSRFMEIPQRVSKNGTVLPAREFPKETVNINGVETELKALNLTKLDENADMFEYGFNHIPLKDLRLFVHMTAGSDRKDMDVFKTLAQNPMNESAQSISMISMADKSTYGGRKFGLVLDVDNANIGHAYYSNTGSGRQKGFKNFVEEVFEISKHRDFVRIKFKEYMNSKGIDISGSEYAAIAKYITGKHYPETQIKDIKIGDRVFTREDILGAFTYSRDQLIEIKQMKTHGEHNEIVGINSKVRGVVAKVNSLEECPSWFLEFARDNNLPIILMGY